jgi:hypothetical protein
MGYSYGLLGKVSRRLSLMVDQSEPAGNGFGQVLSIRSRISSLRLTYAGLACASPATFQPHRRVMPPTVT